MCKRETWSVIFCFAANVFFAITVVLSNKYLFVHYGFPNITLTCVHFIVTFLGLLLSVACNVFQPKKLPIFDMLSLSITFCGFVVLTNLSLEANTVGTYQLIKMMTTPCVMFIQVYCYGKTFSTKIMLTVVRTLIIL